MEDQVIGENKIPEGDKNKTEFVFNIDPQAPLFVIGVTSEVVQIPIWTLRKLDQMGVVKPKRVGIRTRCYSQVQIQTLSYIKHLMEDKQVNISGIKVILEIEDRLD